MNESIERPRSRPLTSLADNFITALLQEIFPKTHFTEQEAADRSYEQDRRRFYLLRNKSHLTRAEQKEYNSFGADFLD